MQIKSTMRYYLTPIRMAVIRKTRNNKCLQGCEEKETLVHCWGKCQVVQETVQRILKKLKIELPYDSTIPLLDVYSKEMKSLSQRYICTTMLIAALFKIITWKQPKCPSKDE